MKRRIVISAMMAAAVIGAPRMDAQINRSTAAGYMARGVAMYNDKNYEGCLDQFVQVRNLDPVTAQQEEALYYMSMATLYCGDDEALDLLNNYLRRYPQSPRYSDVVMATGDYYFTRGAYSEALQAYQSVSADALSDSRREELLYREAYCLMLLSDKARAGELFKQLTTSPEYGNAATFYLAYLAYIDGNYDQAMAYFRKVDTSRDPGTAADYYIAQISFVDKDYSQALQLARKVLEGDCVEQFRPEMNRIAGESLYNLGNADGAIPYLKNYVAESADVRPTAYYILGVHAYNEGNYAEAADMLRQATDTPDAMGQSAYLYLGQSYVKTGNADGALMAFEKAFRDNYDERVAEEAFYNYIVARVDGGRVPFGKSVSTMEEFLKKYPKSRYADDIRENLVTGYMSDNDYESALRIINSTSRPSGKMLAAKQRVLFMMGTRDLKGGRTAQAIENLSEAAAITGANASLHRQSLLWLGNAQLEADQLEEAAQSYLDYLQLAPANDTNRALAYYNLGYTRFRQSRWDDAMTDFRRVADNSAVSKGMRADALNRLADCLYYKQRPGEAATVYSQAYKANPEAGDYALYQAALMRGRQGDNAALINAMDDMLERFPSSPLVPAAMLEKAQAYVALNRTDDAIATYSELAAAYPGASQGRNAYLQLAVTYLNAGNTDEAIRAYKNVIREYPTSDEAVAAIDDLKQIYASQGNLPEFAEFVNSVPNAPRIDASTLDAAAFQAAETDYVDRQRTVKLEDYLADYPQGAYRAQALYYLAEAASNNGSGPEAMEYITTILTDYPDADVAEDALLLKGDNELSRGKSEVALNTYRELEKRASGARELNDARMGIMRASLDLHRYDDVITVTDKIISTTAPGTSDLEEVRFSRAEALDAKGNHDEAYSIWSELAETPGDVYGAKSAVYMAQSMLSQNMAEDARKTADALINAGTPHNYWLARAFIVLSDALRAQGHDFEADEYLKSLKNNYPDNDEDIFLMINDRLNRS
ncbi:MAG: tetratricopeptide repeat protein [Firmicutes bacterium]|nr:tetratricopeptide repeat protein [Bacillota bacterium]MCM1401090.1 tetratricopeptide repeat protein [Bacteroides sp.]MCM1477009.1 tetratricopeptide repeat protein [Bacteroides sp.]